MEKKYINQNRYKKVARSERKRRTEKRNKTKKVISKVPIKNNRIPKAEERVYNNNNNKVIKFIMCIFLTLAIAAISRLIFKDEASPFIPNIFTKKEVNNQNIVIGIIEQDLRGDYIDNLVIRELDSYAYPMLLKITDEYDIEYGVIQNIEKLSNTEYILNINKDYRLVAADIKQLLNECKNKSNLYYPNLENITSIEIVNANALKIYLEKPDNYFIYNLAIPVYLVKNSYNLNYNLTNKTKNKRVYSRTAIAETSLVNEVTVININSLEDSIQKYKNNKLDILFANSKRVIQLLGKYEYNIANYKSGKTLFLLGNLNSEIYSIKEVRKAICYGINRENILNEVFTYNVELIDLPYIYNNVEYQYDIYAAENLLLSNGFKKKNGIYTKKKEGKNIALNIELLVNKKDEEKIKVSEYIKKDLRKIGININIIKVSTASLKNRIDSGNYDLVLADININSNPNTSFIYDKININDSINEKLKLLDELDMTNIKDKINNIIKEEYNQNICYGIKSDNIYMIYSKTLSDISDISYMQLLDSIMK